MNVYRVEYLDYNQLNGHYYIAETEAQVLQAVKHKCENARRIDITLTETDIEFPCLIRDYSSYLI